MMSPTARNADIESSLGQADSPEDTSRPVRWNQPGVVLVTLAIIGGTATWTLWDTAKHAAYGSGSWLDIAQQLVVRTCPPVYACKLTL